MNTSSFDEISENLDLLDDWEDRYRYLIELGETLQPIEPSERISQNKVNGCVSQVWLVANSQNCNGIDVLTFRGASDAMIVSGLVAVLIAIFSGKSASEISQTDAIKIFDSLGLREHLTSQRANGLVAMVDRIKSFAMTTQEITLDGGKVSSQ